MEAKNEQELEDAKLAQENAVYCRAKLAELLEANWSMEIRLSKLHVDPSYQRQEIPEYRLTEMVNDFDPHAFGAVHAGKRKDGTFWLVDTQQRCAAVRRMVAFAAADGQGTPDPLLLCIVFTSRGREHEAAVYHKINGKQTPLKPYEDFKAAVLAAEEPQTSVSAFIGCLGMSIGTPSSKSPNVVGFTNALVQTWTDHENACKRAFRIQRTIVRKSGVMTKPIHKGLWRILSNGGFLSAKDVAHLRAEGKEAICAAISGVQKAHGVTGRPHADDCAEGILVLLGRTIGLRRGRVTVCKTS